MGKQLDVYSKIVWGDGAYPLEYFFPSFLDDYDDRDYSSYTGSATMASGGLQTSGHHLVTAVKFTVPLMTDQDRAEFDNWFRDWGWKLKEFKFYPDEDGDSYFPCVCLPGWLPKPQKIRGVPVYSLPVAFRRLDLDEDGGVA